MRLLRLLPIALLATATSACQAVDTAAVLRLARLEVLAQRLPAEADRAASGDVDAMKVLKREREHVADLIAQLAKSPSGGEIAKAWGKLDGDLNTVIAGEPALKAATAAAFDLQTQIPVISSRMDEVVKMSAELSDGTKAQVMITSREMLLQDRMQRRIALIVAGGEEAQASADGLLRDWQFHRAVLDALLKGNNDLNVTKIDHPSVRSVIGDIIQQVDGLDPAMKHLVNAASGLQDVHEAAQASHIDGDALLLSADAAIATLQPAR